MVATKLYIMCLEKKRTQGGEILAEPLAYIS